MVTTWDTINTSYRGLSTDAKPTECRNGDTFLEIDTSKQYIWDAEGNQWVEQESSGGGGITPSGTLSLAFTSNGSYVSDCTSYASVDVSVDVPMPSGTLSLAFSENTAIPYVSDIAQYASLSVTVDVQGGGGGDDAIDGLIERTISGAYTNSNVSEIGDYVFSSCKGLTVANFPKVTTIGSNAFAGCDALTTASFPSATSIGMYAFNACTSLTSISFPNAITISGSAFNGCNALTTASFPNATTIGASAFYICSHLTTISFPNVTSIDANAFNNCSSLTSVIFPNVTSISTSAFTGCRSLTTASFPSLKSMLGSIFARCYNLLSLYLTGSSVATLANVNAFASTPISNYTTSTGGVNGSIYVKESLYSNWIAANNWSVYSARFVSLTDEQIEALG